MSKQQTIELGSLTHTGVTYLIEHLRGDQVLFKARVTLACLGPDMRPRRLPGDLAILMGS